VADGGFAAGEGECDAPLDIRGLQVKVQRKDGNGGKCNERGECDENWLGNRVHGMKLPAFVRK
jgi:hypothetical protein